MRQTNSARRVLYDVYDATMTNTLQALFERNLLVIATFPHEGQW